MLDKQDSRRQRNPRPNGLELPIPGPASTRDVRASRGRSRRQAPGIRIERSFTRAGDNGYAGVVWEQRTASIIGEGGKVVFEQRDVEVPSGWSQTATNVVVQKYFRGQLGTPGRERSVRQLIDRVADTITRWGMQDGYFADQASADNYRAELKHLLVEQDVCDQNPRASNRPRQGMSIDADHHAMGPRYFARILQP